ncbi:hypothetical protein [Paenibacillus solanacearum]|nr:hypothetical protein [Paenibacillus solanacearum]
MTDGENNENNRNEREKRPGGKRDERLYATRGSVMLLHPGVNGSATGG